MHIQPQYTTPALICKISLTSAQKITKNIILDCQQIKPNFRNKIGILNIQYKYINHHISTSHVLLFTKSLGLNADWPIFSSVCP